MHKSFCLGLMLWCFATAQLTGAKPPNILLIYTDDQSHRTVGCYPGSYDWVQTPNIDQLARQGVRFNHAYIGSWCMPSRATLLTGLHQHGIESMRMEGKYPGSTYDPKQCRFWPSHFRANGYTTAHIGKWHTGVDAGFGRDWDFQIVWNRPRHPENAPNYYDNQLISRNGAPPKMVKGYSTDNYTNWAVDYIEGEGRDTDKPWYLWLCYGAVHGPFTPADRHLSEYKDITIPTPKDIYPPRPGKPEYARKFQFWEKGPKGEPVERKVRDRSPVGMKDTPGRPLRDWVRQYHQGVRAIDEGVGRVLEALCASGQDENTLVVFTSDQGFAWGQHGLKSKVAPYRAAVEAPLIIRPPKPQAEKCAGRVIEEPVSGVDLIPTFFAQAGLELPWKMHGFDLTPLFESREAKWNHKAMLVHTAKSYGSATNTVPAKDDAALYHGPGIPWYVMLCEGRFKYVRTLVPGETEELYDLKADPGELANLAHDPNRDALLQRLREATIAELKRTDAGMVNNLPPVQAPPWKKHVVVPKANSQINSAVANDFDGDGSMDIISSYDGKVVLLRGPDWKPQTIHVFNSANSRNKPRTSCIHSCLMDVDGDGDLDFCGSNLTVFWLECPDELTNGQASSRQWTYRTIDDEILGTHCLITGDVNRDGRLDLIANSGRTEKQTTIPNSLTWLEVPEKPHTAKHWGRHVFADRDAPGGSHYTGFGDINGDGRPDISCGAKGGEGFPGGEWFAWWEQPKDPTTRWRKHLLSDKQPGASNIHPVDVNNDGAMDLIATRGHTKGVLWFAGPEFTPIEIDAEIEGPHCLATVDLDSDGDVDIATCGRFEDGVAAWYENNGEGVFHRRLIGTDQGSYDIRAIDMDGDKDLDLLIAGHDSKNIVWFENSCSDKVAATNR